MRSKLLILATFFNLCLFAMATPLVSAQGFDPFGGVDCSGAAKGSAVCTGQSSGNPLSGPNGLLHKITLIIALIAGAAAVILVVVGAIRLITSGGDAQSVKNARGTIINALVGLAIIVLAASIISFVLGKI
jgi:hypothetical protein